jgi:hypothetical protein
MTKTKILILVLSLIMSTTFLSTVMAKVETPTLTFSAFATGECAILLIDLASPLSNGQIGKGTAVFSGSATADIYYPPSIYLSQSGVTFKGSVNVQWDNQRLEVKLYSTQAKGYFEVNGKHNGHFFAGGWPAETYPTSAPLFYEGTLTDSTGSKAVSGCAMVLASPMGPQDIPNMFLGIWLFQQDGTSWTILWSPADFASPELTLHAANSFMSSVKIKI